MEVNTSLVLQTANFIRLHESMWDQDHYENKYNDCGTTRCFAGWGIVLSHPGIKSIYGLSEEAKAVKLHELGYQDLLELPYLPNSEENYAGLLFGLTREQAAKIFYTMSITDVIEYLQMVQEVTGVDLALFDPPTSMVTMDEGRIIPVQSTESVQDHSGGTGLSEMQEKPAEE